MSAATGSRRCCFAPPRNSRFQASPNFTASCMPATAGRKNLSSRAEDSNGAVVNVVVCSSKKTPMTPAMPPPSECAVS